MKKLPTPVWTNAPAAICDVWHRGHNFRIEVHVNFAGTVWITASSPTVFTGINVHLYDYLDHEAEALWAFKMKRQGGEHGELDLTLPSKKLIRYFDAAVDAHRKKMEDLTAKCSARFAEVRARTMTKEQGDATA